MGIAMKRMRITLYATLVATAVASGLNREALPDETALARQSRGAQPPQKTAMKTVLHDLGSLEALWEREAELAQIEAARFLQRAGGSLEPTSSPVPPPTDPPIGTASPTPGSTGPPTTNPPTTNPPTVAPSPGDSTQTFPPTSLGTESPSSSPTEGGGTPPPSSFTGPPTMEETCLGGATLAEYLAERLSLITDSAILLDPTTPQGMAYQFMVNDPLMQTSVCEYPTVEQRYGLATTYYSTRGDDWNIRTAWLTDTNECIWYGVVCIDEVRATNLTLAVNNMNGPLPEEISTLFMLDRIEMFGNQLSSTLPAGISNLSKIEVLDLEQNSLTGPAFPDSLMQLTSLKQIFLSRNALTGTLPTGIGTFAVLQDFWIAENQMSGNLPEELGLLSHVRTLIVYENKFDMTIPETLGLLGNLTNLQLYENDLDGTIPLGLYGLSQLSVLLLDGNFLNGNIEPDIGLMTTLTDLRLHDNDFQGAVPEEILFLSNLRFFTVGNNFIEGPIPNVFTELTALETLDFADNFHTGPLPASVFALPKISRLYFQGNNITGPIPAFYSDPPDMVDLFFNDNKLSGTIPSIDAGEFTKLAELTFHYNDLTGSMPQSICDLRATGVLDRLFVDCGGADPQIDCLFPVCCNLCFEGENDAADTRRLQEEPHSEEPTQRLLMARHTRTGSDGPRSGESSNANSETPKISS